MSDLPKFVLTEGHRWEVLKRENHPIDGPMLYLLRKVGPLGRQTARTVWAKEGECTTWKRTSVRHIHGTLPHREKRPVHLDINTGAEIIEVRLKGTRRRLSCTFGGLYDLLARQAIANTKNKRAKHIGRKP